MENTQRQELLRRAEDLSLRSARKGQLTHTGFLSPADCRLLETGFHPEPGTVLRFFGGYESAERRIAFFLPEWEDEARIPEEIRAVRYLAAFGEPGHRDWLGAFLASGISRDRLGDILVEGPSATVFCLPGILGHLLTLERVGRFSVKAEEIAPEAVPVPRREVREQSFTVMSLRVDAVAAGMFRLSRSACAELIRAGLLQLNYELCDRVDAPVHEGDVLSLRGHGKGVLAELGGQSRKGRLFVRTEIFV